MHIMRKMWHCCRRNGKTISKIRESWDNTSVDLKGKTTDSDLQRLTYSLYYGGKVAKGGIFLQLCGGLGGWELWVGACSDSDYLERSGVLQFQE